MARYPFAIVTPTIGTFLHAYEMNDSDTLGVPLFATKEEMLKLLSLTDTAEGVQIFIGADNTLFNLAGCSMIVSSYQNSSETILGAIGVIGPTRMNYAHIIPMVDYTSKMISHFLRQQS